MKKVTTGTWLVVLSQVLNASFELQKTKNASSWKNMWTSLWTSKVWKTRVPYKSIEFGWNSILEADAKYVIKEHNEILNKTLNRRGRQIARTPFYTTFAKGKIGKEGKVDKEHNTREVLQGHAGLTTNIDSTDTSIRKAVKIVENSWWHNFLRTRRSLCTVLYSWQE